MGLTLQALSPSFGRYLAATNKARWTILTYQKSLDSLIGFLEAEGISTDVAVIRRRDVEAYIGARLATVKPATVAIAYRSLRVFFGWCVSEDEIDASPMAKIRCPIVPEKRPDVLTNEQIAKLLKACQGKDFVSRRDHAMIRLLLDTGIRRSECAGLAMADINLADGTATVLGKGRRIRTVPIGKRTCHALDRYLRS